MAIITPFVNGKKRGFTIGSLPMPDGTVRTYKEFGRNAFRLILATWRAEKAEMQLRKYEAIES